MNSNSFELLDEAQKRKMKKQTTIEMNQPKPKEGFGDMWKRVIERFEKLNPGYENPDTKALKLFNERRQNGIDKYGTCLQAFNGRNAIEDLIAELLDAMVYAEQIAVEKPAMTEKMIDFQKTFHHQIVTLLRANEQI